MSRDLQLLFLGGNDKHGLVFGNLRQVPLGMLDLQLERKMFYGNTKAGAIKEAKDISLLFSVIRMFDHGMKFVHGVLYKVIIELTVNKI